MGLRLNDGSISGEYAAGKQFLFESQKWHKGINERKWFAS